MTDVKQIVRETTIKTLIWVFENNPTKRELVRLIRELEEREIDILFQRTLRID